MTKYAAFTTKTKKCVFFGLAYVGTTWYIFASKSSKKGSKIEEFFNFTTRINQAVLSSF